MNTKLLLSLLAVTASANYAAEPIYLKKDQPYILELKLNPVTGKIWNLAGLDKENVVKIEQLPSQFYDPLCLGVQGWRVTANRLGSTRATFNYKRPWESHSTKTKIFDFIVE